MTEKNDTPTVSMSNTKKEMLDSYQAIKKRLQEREKQTLDAEKARKQMEKKVAEATADAQASQDPLQRLYILKGDISRELTTLAEKLEQEIDSYRKVQAAVKEKNQELNTLYEIETAASDLAALIEAQQAKKNVFEQEMESRQNAFREEMQETRAKWNKEQDECEHAAKEQADVIKKQRQREKEEYEYAFVREKEQRGNALEDELRALENEIKQKRKDFEQDLNQRNMEIEAREKSLAEKEAEMAHLKKDVETFPQKLKTEIKEAMTSTTERLTSDFEKARALLEAKHEGEKNVLTSKIESFEKLVSSQEAQIAQFAKRHEQAYEKVQDIANRAVAATKREFISVPATTRTGSEQDERNKN
jgi:chromosome segregation ATPase